MSPAGLRPAMYVRCDWTRRIGLELLDAVRSDAPDGQVVGDAGRDLADLVERDVVQRRDRRVGVDVLGEYDRAARGVTGDRARVLEREHESAGRVGAGAGDLLLGGAVVAQLVDDLAHARVRLDAL